MKLQEARKLISQCYAGLTLSALVIANQNCTTYPLFLSLLASRIRILVLVFLPVFLCSVPASAQQIPGINLIPVIVPTIPPVVIPPPTTLFNEAIDNLAGGDIVLQILEAPSSQVPGLLVRLINTSGVDIPRIVQTLGSFDIVVPVLESTISLINNGISLFDTVAPTLSVNLSNTAIFLNDLCMNFNNIPNDQATALLTLCLAIEQFDPADIQGSVRLLANIAIEEAFVLVDSLVALSDVQTTQVLNRLNALRRQADQPATRTALASEASFHVPAHYTPLMTALALYSDGPASSDFASRLGTFFSGHVSSREDDGGEIQQDSEVSINTLTLGADYRLGKNIILGVATGFLEDDTDLTNTGGGAQSEGINVTFFASWYEGDEGYFDVVLDSGHTEFELQRTISLVPTSSLTTLSSTSSRESTFTVSAGRHFRPAGIFDLTGHLQATHSRATIAGYTETLQDAESNFVPVFAIGEQSTVSTRMVFGLDISKAFNTPFAVVTPQLNLKYVSENERDKDAISAVEPLTGTRVEYVGQKRVSSYTSLGFGISAVFPRGRSAYAYYETLLQHDLSIQNSLTVGIRLEF